MILHLCCGFWAASGSDMHPVRGMLETHRGHHMSLVFAPLVDSGPWTESTVWPSCPRAGFLSRRLLTWACVLGHQEMVLVPHRGHLPCGQYPCLESMCTRPMSMRARRSWLQQARGLSCRRFLLFSLLMGSVALASGQEAPMTTPFSNREPKKAEAPTALRSGLWLGVW